MNDKEKWRSIGIVSRRTRWNNEADRRLAKDMAAYKRLRFEGHQPPRVDGSAALERDAAIPMEIEMGKVFDKADQGAAKDGWDMSYEIGLRGPKR